MVRGERSGPQMFVVSCISMDWFCMVESRCGRNEPVFTFFCERLIVCRWQEWHSHAELRLMIDLMFIGHFAPS